VWVINRGPSVLGWLTEGGGIIFLPAILLHVSDRFRMQTQNSFS